MKKIVLACALSALLYGDEIERINALVKEIANLRTGYEQCKHDLDLYKHQTRMQENDSQVRECEDALHKLSLSSKNESQKLQKEIENLKNQIKKYKNSLKIKSNKIAKLEKELAKYKSKKHKNMKNQIKKKHQTSTKEVCLVPAVIIKEKQKQTHIALDKEGRVVIKESYKITTTRPKTFRTLREAVIYDKPGGVRTDKWEKGRSFTSYIESGSWIKITGYFVNRKWTKAKKEMWIKKSDAFERE